MTLEKDSYPFRMREQLLFSCQNTTIRSGAFIVAMALLPYKIYFTFSKKGCERAIPPTTEVVGLLAMIDENLQFA